MNILINAYSVRPDYGSEPGMGWNWIINLAKQCKIFIITEGEWKDEIDAAIKKLPQKENIQFYFNPVPEKVRKMCWNQGDWRFYYYYKQWQRKSLIIARNIINENDIDILHQLNMIGFREPGYLWKIEGIPFIWGPIGGMENFPLAYLKGAPLKQKVFNILKNVINSYQIRYSIRVGNAISRADALVAAVNGVKEKIEWYYKRKVFLINETGCYVKNEKQEFESEKDNHFDIIWVGKFDFRKQLALALNTIAKTRFLPGLKFHIIGTGLPREVLFYRNLAKKLLIEDVCIWHGSLSNEEVQRIMQNSQLLFFSSVMEGTPHVVLEAIGNNLPVLCFNTCGQGVSVNSEVGIKIELNSIDQSINAFSENIIRLYQNRKILSKLSGGCSQRQIELSWDIKTREMIKIYESILNTQAF